MNVHHAEDFRTDRARGFFRLMRGELPERDRAIEIEALPRVDWKGRRLRTIRCHGTSGKGPHDVNVPEAMLWVLIDLDGWLCPYHPNDRTLAEDAQKGI